jgi:hypothetical protein
MECVIIGSVRRFEIRTGVTLDGSLWQVKLSNPPPGKRDSLTSIRHTEERKEFEKCSNADALDRVVDSEGLKGHPFVLTLNG